MMKRKALIGALGLALAVSPAAMSTALADTPAPSTSSSPAATTPVTLAPAPKLQVSSALVDLGATITADATGCPEGTRAQVVIAMSGDKILATGTGKLEYKPAKAGFYGIRAACFNASDDKVASAVSPVSKVFVSPTGIDISPSTWREGEKVSFTVYGLPMGDKLVGTVTRNGKTYWTFSGTAQGRGDTFKTVLADKVIPNNGPRGSYVLTIKDTKTGQVRTTSFYWGRPDSKPSTPAKPGKPSTPKPGKDAPKHGPSTLPSTGD